MRSVLITCFMRTLLLIFIKRLSWTIQWRICFPFDCNASLFAQLLNCAITERFFLLRSFLAIPISVFISIQFSLSYCSRVQLNSSNDVYFSASTFFEIIWMRFMFYCSSFIAAHSGIKVLNLDLRKFRASELVAGSSTLIQKFWTCANFNVL